MSTLSDLLSIGMPWVEPEQLDTQRFADALKEALGSELEPDTSSQKALGSEVELAERKRVMTAVAAGELEVIEVEESQALAPAPNAKILRAVRSDASASSMRTILDEPSDSEPAVKKTKWEKASTARSLEAVVTDDAETGCVSYRMKFKGLPFKYSAVETVHFAVSVEDELTELVFGVRQ